MKSNCMEARRASALARQKWGSGVNLRWVGGNAFLQSLFDLGTWLSLRGDASLRYGDYVFCDLTVSIQRDFQGEPVLEVINPDDGEVLESMPLLAR